MIWRKVTARTRHQLIQVFLHMGRGEAEELSLQHGLHKDYAINQARALSLVPKKKFSGGGDIAKGCDHKDPRWAWAIDRGPVCAP